MQRVLELHKGYPSNKDQLTGKRGPEPEYRTPKDIPRVEQRHCIECHQVRGNVLRHKWQEKCLTAADILALSAAREHRSKNGRGRRVASEYRGVGLAGRARGHFSGGRSGEPRRSAPRLPS